MTAGRLYVVQSWNNASAYSGEQIGTRLAHSKELHFTRDGRANTALYSDEEVATTPKKKKPNAYERVCLADRHYSRLEREKQELDSLLDDGEISWNDWLYAMKQLQPRMDRAWKKIVKLREWDQEDDRENLEQDEEPINSFNWQANNESPIVSPSQAMNTWASEIMMSLNQDNIFRKAYMKIKRIAEALK